MSSDNSRTVAQARQAIFAAVSAIEGSAELPLRQANGRVLATTVLAPRDVPAHDNSAVDGYALATGTTARFEVIGSAFAGHPFTGSMRPGQAVRIMTGAMIPAGTTAVVAQEDSQRTGDAVEVSQAPPPGANIRRAGEDLAQGAPALTAGRQLGPAEIGMLASLGIDSVCVHRRLRVACLSTGDELATPGQAVLPGQIHDSNRPALLAALDRLGMEGIDLGAVADEPTLIEQALRTAAAKADVILTSGGVSVGEADHIRPLLNRLGSIDFWRIDMKPGRPMAFGRIGDAWLFGLPGNPVAALVAFYQIARDGLLRLAGVDPVPPQPSFLVPCTEALRKLPGRREFVRGRLFLDGSVWHVRPLGQQGSGMLRSMVEANCFIVLNEQCGPVAAGDAVEVQPFAGVL
jgi:molybdopterin molybdotransferase